MSASPFAIRGAIEGFYGNPYTFPERNDMIRFLGANRFNYYFYGPKNDRQHRARWREPYPAETMRQFSYTSGAADKAGVRFCYAISPVDARKSDADAISRKLEGFCNIGVRCFGIFLDDTPEDKKHAELHAHLANRALDSLRKKDSDARLFLCPAKYHGLPPFGEYLRELGGMLDKGIDIFYTGPDVCSHEITSLDAAEFAKATGRRPVIWDNFPVNDLAMKKDLHLGPIRNREPLLHRETLGMAFNLMTQEEASKIPLMTIADFLADPSGYEPGASWEKALSKSAGKEYLGAMKIFAENCLTSCVADHATKAETLANAVVEGLEKGGQARDSPAVREFMEYMARMDDACYTLKTWMRNIKLRAEILPWINLLETWAWLGKRSVQALLAIENNISHVGYVRSVEESLNDARGFNRSIGGRAMEQLAEYTIRKGMAA